MILDWTLDKIRIGELTGLTDDQLHIYVGLLIFFGIAILLRSPPWRWRPWLAVVAAETANELYDLLQTRYPSDEGNFAASAHDIWFTLFLPTLIAIAIPLVRRMIDRGAMGVARECLAGGIDLQDKAPTDADRSR